MKRISTLPALKRFIALSLFILAAVSASAQVYYLNVYGKNGNRTRFVIDDLDSVSLSFEKAPIEGLRYVDLGLPSGMLWADRNVGATSPFEAGDYFAWGETQPKEKYTNASYKFYQKDESKDFYKITKYNFYSEFGAVDCKYRLDMEDDAARANWGSDWRMPTAEEMEELVEYCDWQWLMDTVRLHFIGYKVTGPNGNSIYLPIGQCRYDEEGYVISDGDSYAAITTSYLSSTLDPEEIGNAQGIDIYYELYKGETYTSYGMSPEGRVFGELIRPVYSWQAPDNVIPVTHFDVNEKQVTLSIGDFYMFEFDMDSSAYLVPQVIVKGDGLLNYGDGAIKAILPGEYRVIANLGEITVEMTVTVIEPQIVAKSVDLGLSVKWATTNLGAETPSQYGYYYAWGEIEPKADFTINNYKWFDNDAEGFSKYVNDPDYGTVDEKGMLELDDDAARKLWGDTWRIPTVNEFNELIRNCSWEDTIVNGVSGYKVTSLIPGFTDNYIFLPLAGFNSSYNQGNEYGYYWSSSKFSDLVDTRANGLLINLEKESGNAIRTLGFSRHMGLSIRPVEPYGATDVDSVMIDTNVLQLAVGQIYQMSAYGYTAGGKIIAVDGLTWASSDTTVATVDNGVIKAVAEGTATITATYNDKVIECMVTVNDPDKPYVDLGLSVKWATCNIGATTPTEFGDYYAWGETEPKSCYNDTTYKWYDVNTKTYSKYNFIPEKGTVDLKYRLDPEDDVAYKVLGEGWRMPTFEEITELLENCSVRWIYNDSVTGCEFISKINGNSIFLPATGYIFGSDLYEAGNHGIYMSSSLIMDATSDYNIMCLEANYYRNYFRFSGYTVRPVYSSTFADNVLQFTEITLSEQTVSVETGQQVELKATIDCDTTVAMRWTSDNPAVARVDNNGVVVGVSAGECVVTASFGGMSQSCAVTVTEGAPLIESVDLGLSVMWATANVGASRVEDYGGYYAWGETEQKATYEWENYSWADASDPDDLIMTKYNAADGKFVLDPDDDVAHVKWQGEWRMPTRTEFQELFDECEWEDSVQLNGVWGRKATGPNGNSIFMPYAGYYVGATCHYEYGSEYATSSLYDYDVMDAYVADYEVWAIDRRVGLSVRPVRPYAANEISGITLSKETIGLLVGDSCQLTFKEQITGALDAQWISADESVATVQDGLVTALSTGSTEIVVVVGNFKDTCVINVSEKSFVNLGLSVNWATFNLGAGQPSEYGDYYAWGETEPKSVYSWNNYKFGPQGAQTKYAMKVDGIMVLDADDDAVKAKWGGDWRMPTNKEFGELIDNCTWEWTTLDGVNGFIVTSTVQGYEGNYIFLPAAGLNSGTYARYVDEYGVYWTSSMNDNYSDDYSKYAELGSSEVGVYNMDKFVGLTIRPVCPNPDYVPAEDPVVLTDNMTIVVNDYVDGVKREFAEPRIVADPADSTNNCIVVTTNDHPTNVYDSEFIITINEELNAGDQVYLSMKVKADEWQSSGQVVAQTAPGVYAGGATFSGPSFGTRWNDFDCSFRISKANVNTYAFSLSYLSEGNNLYFDDISITVVDTWAGELLIDKDELSMNVGSAAYQLSIFDNAGTPYADYAQWSSSNDSVATVNNFGKVTAVSEGTATITATFRGTTATCVVTVVPYEPVTDYVDLGLSVNWATCNLGALNPNDAGFYYAWAETDYKSEYSWSTYSYSEGNDYSLTKYVLDENSGGYNGFFDGLRKLEAEDDAASVIMGGNWRMATASEFEELIDNCEWTFMYNDDGTMGYKITSMVEGYEDQSIFLPINGFKTGTRLSDQKASGYYWTSSLSTSYSSAYALNLAFGNYGRMEVGMDYRNYGMAIRPVIPNQNYVDKVILTDNVTIKVKDYVNGENVTLEDPRIVADPDNAYNQCIVVTTEPNPQDSYSEEFFLTVNDELLLGQTIELSMRIKAEKSQSSCQIVAQSANGEALSFNPFRTPEFNTDWVTMRVSVPVTDTRLNTFSFCISILSEGNNVYFDDISATISDSYNGGLYIYDGDFTMETGASSYTLTLYDQDYDSWGEYATWTSSNENVATVDEKGAVTPVAAGTAVITAEFRGETTSVTVTVNQYVPVTEYVDLGLSVNWATCNIGAYTPEAVGYYYSWASLTTANDYKWSNTPYYSFSLNGAKFKKYTDSDGSSYSGSADNLFVLETADDVAAQLMGGNWRMATAEEFEELINNCVWEFEYDKEGNSGYRITSKVDGYTDKSIFLPANGYRMDQDQYYSQSYGYYWTSSLNRNDGSVSAKNLHFESWGGYAFVSSERRYVGMAIRPVIPNENYVDKILLTDNFTLTATEYPEGQKVENGAARQIADPDNASNQCIVVTTNSDPTNSYNTQLFIRLNEALTPGMEFTVSMRIKADKYQGSESVLLDSDDIYLGGFAQYESPYFETTWTNYSKTVSVSKADTKTLALNVSTLSEGNNLYFDDIMVTVRDTYGGNLSFDNNDVTLEIGSGAYELYAYDDYGNSFNDYATWTSSNENVATVDSRGRVKAVGIGSTTITAQFRDDVATCTVTVNEYEPVSDVVDLGLSVKWATCNLGATAPQSAGFYYAWAETTPKSEYTWDNYSYCENGNEEQLTKYSYEDYSSYSGVADNLIVLAAGDDAATQVLGGSFRTATPTEFEELINLCTWKLETVNGTTCYRITSNVEGYENNSILIPANGYMMLDEHNSGSYLYYWTSSLDLYGKSSYAQYLYTAPAWFGSPKPTVSSELRLMGMGIRPVVTSETWPGITSVSVEDQVSLVQYDSYALSAAVWSGNADYSFMAGDMSWTSSDEDVVTVDEYGQLIAVAAGQATVTVTYKNLSAECAVTVSAFSYVADGTENNHEYVDLGLSVNWATYNLGSTSLTGLGDYYAWGEVEPYYANGYAQEYDAVWKSGKESGYVPESNRYYASQGYSNHPGWTKYCLDPQCGKDEFSDSLSVLLSSDDAASVNWGGTWRMPDDAEFDELQQNCDWLWVTLNGVEGFKVVSRVKGYEDKYIFLPVAGMRSYESYYEDGGFYWSRSLYSEYPEAAYGIGFSDNYGYKSTFGRSEGMSIRAVCPKD